VLLLIDTRDLPPEPGHEGGDAARFVAAALRWLFPWPAIIIWFAIGGLLFEGLLGAAFAFTSMWLMFWRLTKVYPDSGLNRHSQ
jgi:hypothetical protein